MQKHRISNRQKRPQWPVSPVSAGMPVVVARRASRPTGDVLICERCPHCNDLHEFPVRPGSSEGISHSAFCPNLVNIWFTLREATPSVGKVKRR